MIKYALACVFVAALYLTVVLPTLPHWMIVVLVGRLIGSTDIGYRDSALFWLRLEWLGHER